MKNRFGHVFSVVISASIIYLSPLVSFGAPPVLSWNGSSGDEWDTSTTNWLDSGDNPVAWQNGSEASFEGSGGIINVSSDLSVSNITFTGSGYTLLGAGRLSVEGTLSASSGTTNCIATRILTGDGLSKTGDGAVALADCIGILDVDAGVLLVSGSGFKDADITVATNATLQTLGGPDTSANLILNPGFELPAMSPGTYSYVAYGNIISNWVTAAVPLHLGRQNVDGVSTPWNSANSAPEGVHMLIMQYDSAVEQTVTVPSDGLYNIAFSYILRNNYPQNQVYVYLDDMPLATFLNTHVQFDPGRFRSGLLYLSEGSHTLKIAGEGGWGDCTSMIDAVCFAAPSASNGCGSLTGDSILQVEAGASVQLDHSGTIPLTYVSIDGSAASGTFDSSHGSGIFSGNGALSCSTPGNLYAWDGSGNWSDAGRWLTGSAPSAGGGQNLMIYAPTGDGESSTNDLTGTFISRRLSIGGIGPVNDFFLTGNNIVITNSTAGSTPDLTATGPGNSKIAVPLRVNSSFDVTVEGKLDMSGSDISLLNGSTLSKMGNGTLILPTLTNTPNFYIYGGSLEIPSLPSSVGMGLLSQTGTEVALTLTQAGTYNNSLTLMGAGTCTVASSCEGGTVTLSNWTYGRGSNARFDVDTGDTLSIQQMLLVHTSRGDSITTLTKSGPGTLEIRSDGSGTGNYRAYQGATTLRNGTLRVLEDDYGTLSGWTNPFNGVTYPGYGGSLGYSSFSTAFTIGDSGTAPTDDLAFIAAGDGRWIGHDIEINDVGNSVTLGMTEGTVKFDGTLTLHRDIILDGPSDGIMVFEDIVAAPDFNGTGLPALSGLEGLILEGDVPSELSLQMDARALSIGTYVAREQTLNYLSIGSPAASATLNVDFGAGVNDRIDVTIAGGLTISNTVVNLFYAETGDDFAEPGEYTLFTYTAPLGGSASLLSVGNPQSGASYSFSNDVANSRILLTIGNASGGTYVVWKNGTGGSWASGSNWDTGNAPNSSGVKALFGAAITNDSTVSIASPHTAGGLIFNNPYYDYMLSGSSLTLDDGGSTPVISVLSGAPVIDTTLNGSTGVEISAENGTRLVLSSNAVINTDLSINTGLVEAQGTVAVNNTLSGSTGSTMELAGTSPELTVSQDTDSTFSGILAGVSGGVFAKEGSGTLTLDNPLHTYAGGTEVNAGTLALESSVLGGAVEIAASGTIEPLAVTNGLMGYFYSNTPNTNNYFTLAGMEAHFASLTPDVISPSGLTGDNFDYGEDETCTFPQPYGAGGSRTTNFEAVWRGTISIPESGVYVLGVYCDDGFLLAIDGTTLVYRPYYSASWTERAIRLEAGKHDMVLGYFQLTGGEGMQMRVTPPGTTTSQPLPNSWLTPASSIGALTGSGALDLTTSNSVLNIAQSTDSEFSGTLSGSGGSLLAKSGSGTLSLSGSSGAANGFSGDVEIQEGSLSLTTDNRIGDSSILRVRSNANLTLASAETVAGLSGSGTLGIGGYAYMKVFTDDSDCGVSSGKTYTHALDFPSGTASPVINGVTFNSAGFSGTSGAYGWSVTAGTAPSGNWNSDPYDYSYSGITSLLYDFTYNSYDFTMTFTGLTPGQTYELRIYFRNWANNQRNLRFTFSNDDGQIATLTHNPDSVNRSYVACRYSADSSGTVSMRIESLHTGDSCHMYGLSNEVVPGSTQAALTLAPGSGANNVFSGDISGNGTLTKNGAGTQHLSGSVTLSQPLDIEAGAVALDNGASVTAGAAITAGATLEASSGNVSLGSLTGEGTFDVGNTPTNVGPYIVEINGDSDCDISTDKTYTHTLDFGSNGNKAIINGVAFYKVTSSSGSINGYGWSGMPSTAHAGGNAGYIDMPSSESIYNLLYDMNYGPATATMHLTGLTPGKYYEVRLYHRCWNTGNIRTQIFTFDPDGAGPISDQITFNPDAISGYENYLGYRYLAVSDEITISYQAQDVHSYHLYGITNEETYDTVATPVTLNIAEDNVFDGTVIGTGAMVKSGAGTLTFTGNNTADGSVAVNAGAFGVAGGGTATEGPVSVASGAALFGDGIMGGSVSIASNAVIFAGTSGACGTLQIGGDLVIEQGALPYWRYDSGESDTTTVNGLLVFPSNGVLQVESLTAGLQPPARGTVFSSTQPIEGPDDLSGWTVEGATVSSLIYSDDRTKIYFSRPSGTLIMVR